MQFHDTVTVLPIKTGVIDPRKQSTILSINLILDPEFIYANSE